MSRNDYGSLVNMALAGNVAGAPKPEVGMGCTLVHWSDRLPATIVKVDPKGNRFWMTEDDWKRTDNNGMSESQEYEYFPKTDLPEECWIEVKYKKARKSKRNPEGIGGKWETTDGVTVSVGRKEKYYDFSF